MKNIGGYEPKSVKIGEMAGTVKGLKIGEMHKPMEDKRAMMKK
jgi:hypothetical protein